MKTILLFILFFLGTGINVAYCQWQEFQEFIIASMKFENVKASLKEIKTAYFDILAGYKKIKDISSGNYKLHEVFLDQLMNVSPEIRKYKKIADIIGCQRLLLKEYKKAFELFRGSGRLTLEEIGYMQTVYNNLFDKSKEDLDELLIVTTDGKAQMSDDQRLKAIDRIYEEMQDKLNFLRYFNNQTSVLIEQRIGKQRELYLEKALHGIN